MKKIFFKIILLLPIPALIIAVNFTFDPAHLFKKGGYEQELATYLLQGKNAANITNYDVRLFEKDYIESLNKRKDIIALGSSRSLTLTKDLFPKQSFFNNSINGASIDDYRYVYQIYLQKHLVPKTVIIGLDPWILNANKYDQSQTYQNPMVKNAEDFVKTKTGITPDSITKFYQLISPSYFQSSIPLLLKKMKGEPDNQSVYAVQNSQDPYIDKYTDGSANLGRSFGNDPQKAKNAALTYDPIPLLGNFKQLDSKAISDLESLINLMQQNSSNVVFYLPPYNPTTYHNLVSSQDYKIIIDVQNYFQSLAKKKNLKVYGSYNPEDYQLTEQDFYDGTHPKYSAVYKIFYDKIGKR